MRKKRFSKYLLITALTLLPAVAAGGGGELEERLKGLLPEGAEWSMSVMDINTNSVIYDVRSGSRAAESASGLTPASLVKLFTSGASLEHANKIDMTTYISRDAKLKSNVLNGNLYLTGRGNALLSEADLRNAVKDMLKSGIKTVNGNIVADDTLFDASGLARTRKGPAYAPPSALGLDLHTVAVSVMPSKAGEPPVTRIVPFNNSVRFSVSARTIEGGINTLSIIRISDTEYSVSGSVAQGTKPAKERFALEDPALYAAGVLKTLLEEAGVKISGSAVKGAAPKDAVVITKINAPGIRTIVRDMSSQSVNVLADNLLLLIGVERYGAPGTKEKGTKALEEFAFSFTANNEAPRFADGSGLSSDNKITTKALAAYLSGAAKKPWFDAFAAGLETPGHGRAQLADFADKDFIIKTGGLEDVFSVAGYGTDMKGRKVAFAFMANGKGAGVFGGDRAGAEALRYVKTGVMQ